MPVARCHSVISLSLPLALGLFTQVDTTEGICTAAWRPVQFLRKRLPWQWLWSGESPYYSNETIYHPLSVETEGCFRPNLANEMYFFSRPVITLCRLLLQWWAGVNLISNNRLIPATVARNRSQYVWKLLIRLFPSQRCRRGGRQCFIHHKRH